MSAETILAACRDEFTRIRNDLLETMAQAGWTDEQIAGGEQRVEYWDELIDRIDEVLEQ